MNYLNSVRLPSFAKANEGADTKVIDKAVYIDGEASLKAVVLHVASAADATFAMIGAMVTHYIIRAYHPVDAERRSRSDAKEEMLDALKAYAEHKRGKEFGKAWVYKFLSVGEKMARSLVTDYDKKGVQEGSPLQSVLRAKTVDKAVSIIVDFQMAKTRGVNTFAALEKALTPKKPKVSAGGSQGKPGSNATKASTDKPARIAAAIMQDKGFEIINAIAGKPKAKAEKMAVKIGESNVDHLAFVLKSLTFIDTPEALMQIADRATDLAKAMASKGQEHEEKGEAAAVA